MFDKKQYWERRKKGLSGQVNLVPKPKIALWTEQDHKDGKCGKKAIGKERISGVHTVMTKKGLMDRNRKQRRRKFVDHSFTKKGFGYGVDIKSRRFKENKKRLKARLHFELNKRRQNIPLPTKDPSKSNKERLLEARSAKA